MSDLYKIPIIENSAFDLSKLDFSFIGFSIVATEREDFKNFINNISVDSDLEFIYKLLNENKSPFAKYAIIPNDNNINFAKNINAEEIFKFLLIINYSLQVSYNILIENFMNGDSSIMGIQKAIIYPVEEDFIIDEQIDSINVFAIKYFNNYQKKLIKKIIDNYYNSFLTDHNSFRYISLYTCLENLVLAGVEQAYRMQRVCAIIVVDDFKNRERIFENIGKLKNFRNEFVHGGEINNKKLYTHLSYLRNLISALITRLFFIDNENFTNKNYDINSINKWITTVGYSDRLFLDCDNFLYTAKLNISKYKKINVKLE